MNYTTLTAQILSYANRTEPAFVNNIPNIINQAMSRIYSDATCLGFQKIVNGNMTIDSNLILKPADFKSAINLEIIIPPTALTLAQRKFLLARTYEFCILYAPYPVITGEPEFYSADLDVPQIDVGRSSLFISPIPDKDYQYQLTYLSFPPTFNVDNPVNFLTDKYPNLLLYACMMEAIPYLKSDERIPVFESLYSKALQGVNNDTKNRYTDRYLVRDKD